MTSLVISDHVLLRITNHGRVASLWLVRQDRATINSGSPPSCDVTFWPWSVASPSEMGWLASKVSRYLSVLCLWFRPQSLCTTRTRETTVRAYTAGISTPRPSRASATIDATQRPFSSTSTKTRTTSICSFLPNSTNSGRWLKFYKVVVWINAPAISS